MIVEKVNAFSFCEINATKFGTKIDLISLTDEVISEPASILAPYGARPVAVMMLIT